MKICIVIPVYNECQAILELLCALRLRSLDVLVVDDGSTDGSGEIAIREGAHVIHHPQNKGKGASLREGFRYIKENGYEGVVVMDGDGQHDPADLPFFLQAAGDPGVDMVVGNRMGNAKNMPLVRYLTNKFMSALISSICQQKIPDTQCGYRFIRTSALKVIEFRCDDFEIETEMLIEASRRNLTIVSVPVKTIYRNEKSKIRPVKDSIRFFKYYFKELWTKKR